MSFAIDVGLFVVFFVTWALSFFDPSIGDTFGLLACMLIFGDRLKNRAT